MFNFKKRIIIRIIILFCLICISRQHFSQKLYWADITSDKIQYSDLDGSNITDLLISLYNPRGIAIDHIRDHLYYTDDGNNKIVRIDLDGSNSTDIITSGVTTPYSIELDIHRGKMYWCDISSDRIRRADLDGSNVETVVDLTSDNIYGFALDLVNEKIYIAQNTTDKITVADLDGSNKSDLITGLDQPNGVVLDLENEHIYWTETGGDRIARADLDGSNVATLISGLTSPRQIRIDFINDKLYWTDVSEDKIQSANLDGSGVSNIVTSLSTTYTLFLYDVGTDCKSELAGNWSSAASWNQTVPNNSSTDVDINADLIVDGNYTVRNLGIRSGGSININADCALTVTGNISNNSGSDGIIISSDASNTGSLIVSGTNSAENATVERYMTGAATGWHLVGVPVTGQGINDLVIASSNNISTSGSQYGLGIYNEASDIWTTYTTSTAPGSGNLTPGMGYETNRSSDGNLSYIGTLANSQVDVAVTKDGNGWNLVGNPFPCALYTNTNADATNNFITVNTAELDDSFEAIYIWNASTSDWDIVNQSSGASYIPSGQGFFIKAASAGTVNFTTAMRVHQTSSTFKEGAIIQPKITLKVDDGVNQNSTLFKFVDGCSELLDPGYDAGMYNGIKSELELYSRMDGMDIAYDLQCYPKLDQQAFVIPIELESEHDGEIDFSASIKDLPSDYKVYLEDRKKKQITLLTNGEISNTSISSAIIKDRFYLHITRETIDKPNDDQLSDEISVYPDLLQSRIFIKGILSSNAQVKIYAMNGALVYSGQLNNRDFINVHLESGIHVLNISDGIKEHSQKINWIK